MFQYPRLNEVKISKTNPLGDASFKSYSWPVLRERNLTLVNSDKSTPVPAQNKVSVYYRVVCM